MLKSITPADWQAIRRHFRAGFSTNLHVAVATAGFDGQPTVAPIGSFLLDRERAEGIFFEIFTSSIPRNAPANKRVCVMSVNSGHWFWLRAFFRGRFLRPPMIKLYGTIGERRAAAPEEVERLRRRFGMLFYTPGGKKLWGNLPCVREIQFDGFETANVGPMNADF